MASKSNRILEAFKEGGNLMAAGGPAHLSRAANAQRADDLLKRFGLDEHGNKYPAQLSGGQRQRVAIAQQFMCSEDILLMDEPFSGLDLLAAGRVSGFIREMAASDELKTFILVTHDVSAALQVCDEVLLLGRDRDAQGNVVPGARIQKTYNLVERGLAWQQNITTTPEYIALMQEIRADFPRL